MRFIPVRAAAAAIPALGLVLLAASPAAAQPPPNDDFDDAILFTELPFEDSRDTSEATEAADDPSCVGGEGHTVWYDLRLDATTEVIVDTFGSDYDTTLSAWTGSRGDLTQVACDDDTQELQSLILFTAQAGVTYHLMVGSFPFAEGGNLILTAQQAPPRMELGVTLDPTGSVTDDGAATIHGRVSCSREADLVGQGTLRQDPGAPGGSVTVGSFRTAIPCDGVGRWEATVLGETGRYQPGTANGVIFVEFTDPVRGDVVRARATGAVQLR